MKKLRKSVYIYTFEEWLIKRGQRLEKSVFTASNAVMAEPLCIEFPDAFCHVSWTCDVGANIFCDDSDKVIYL